MILRNFPAWLVIFLLPASLVAENSTPALLRTTGTSWINGASVPGVSTVFPGDLVQTKSDSSVKVSNDGLVMVISPDSLAKYGADVIGLEHGAVLVQTNRNFSARAGDVIVSPASTAWTSFAVANLNGTVHIIATKGDIIVDDGKEKNKLSEGQQASRDESQDTTKKKKKKRGGAAAAATGSVLNSPAAIAAGTAAVAGVAAWVLIQPDTPISPVR